MINYNRLIKEHKEMFPKAGLIGQLLKYFEETREFNSAMYYEQQVRESADRLICIVGVMRFSKTLARILLKELLLDLYWTEIQIGAVHSELVRKWGVNQGRKWEYKRGLFGGKYKHVGKDGNE